MLTHSDHVYTRAAYKLQSRFAGSQISFPALICLTEYWWNYAANWPGTNWPWMVHKEARGWYISAWMVHLVTQLIISHSLVLKQNIDCIDLACIWLTNCLWNCYIHRTSLAPLLWEADQRLHECSRMPSINLRQGDFEICLLGWVAW